MGNYKPNQKDIRRWMIDNRRKLNGDRCDICNRSFKELQQAYGSDFDYVREHADGNPANWDVENIRITCNSCNQRKRPDFQEGPSATGNSVCEIANGSESETQKARQAAKLRNAPIEIEINRKAEPLIRRYYWEHVGRIEKLFVEDAPDEAAEYAGCSPVTARRILGKMKSRSGPFKTAKTPSGEEYLVLRDTYKPSTFTWTGEFDLQMLKEQRDRLQAAKQIAEHGHAVALQRTASMEQTNEAMIKSLAKVGKERNYLIETIMKISGMSYADVTKMLSKMDDDKDDGAPAAPVAKIPPGVQ